MHGKLHLLSFKDRYKLSCMLMVMHVTPHEHIRTCLVMVFASNGFGVYNLHAQESISHWISERRKRIICSIILIPEEISE